ncbi:MAG TPA: YdeI/OmpD-associated family protein [Gammaproteobacteria bacterium]|nr:YdeI/OmpD-associated family protein [Gammaproteobacteria bacterium]
MSTPSSKVDAFLARAKTWQAEMRKLRSIVVGCGLDEDIKWGKPCFTFEGKNVAILQPFKAHCALMFFKGALLEDKYGLLRSQGENTQSSLRLEFRSEAEIKKPVVEWYVKQAIAVEKSGRKVDLKARRALELPEELSAMLQKDKKLGEAFRALTPGRQRGYVLHFAAAKQPKTRIARIEKCIPAILAGKGINDR